MKDFFFFIQHFLWHQISASSRYQIHSPYLYKFLNEILRGKPDQKVNQLHREERKKCRDQKPVFSLKKAQVLARMFVLLKPDESIVCGASSELVARLISEFAPKSRIHEIRLTELPFAENDLHIGFSEMSSVDFAFYDGSDNIEGVKNFFDKCILKKRDHSILMFNSIYRSRRMKQAWNEIVNHSETMVSIDLFFLGMVIFKQGLSRQHIKYRY